MKKQRFWLFYLFFFLIFPSAHAGGGITHMFLAEESIQQLPDAKLRHLLLDNLDAYLVGAYYPDSGYTAGTGYGEDSHWDPFIYAFADYIKETYPNFSVQNPKLVAFLFGCAAHRVSDEILHWGFFPIIAGKDFNNDEKTAHSYGDTGIDLLINVDKNLWQSQPATWWVPVKDLVNVYRRMGKDQYSAKQIIWGNTVISIAGYAERLIAAPAYPYLQWKMPWTAAHYYDWPEGGIVMNEYKVAEYQMALWQRLQGKAPSKAVIMPQASANNNTQPSDIQVFAENAIKNEMIGVTTTYHPDGSVEIDRPFIKQEIKFQTFLNQFLAKITHQK